MEMKCAIYLRVSSLEQDPEKQKDECLTFAKSRGYGIEGIYIEQLSGYKQIVRPVYDEVKAKAFRGEIQAVIVWALDRWVRNRDTLMEDCVILRNYNCKLHSVREQWLEAINIEGSLGKTIQEFLLGLIGSTAEMESKRKSDRVKMAFKSHKGKHWGRPDLSKQKTKQVLELRADGFTMRNISNQLNISLGVVHKICNNSVLEKHQ